MLAEKINAIDMHKFIKENLNENCKTVDLRDNELSSKNVKVGRIYIKTNEGLELNYILYNDHKFCISSTNKSISKKLEKMSPTEINEAWHNFLISHSKFFTVNEKSLPLLNK